MCFAPSTWNVECWDAKHISDHDLFGGIVKGSDWSDWWDFPEGKTRSVEPAVV